MTEDQDINDREVADSALDYFCTSHYVRILIAILLEHHVGYSLHSAKISLGCHIFCHSPWVQVSWWIGLWNHATIS